MNIFKSISTPRSYFKFGSSIQPSSHSNFEESDFFELNFENFQSNIELNTKPPSPSFIVNSGPCVSIHDEIRDFKCALTKILPKKISSPYTFLDIQILQDEFHAAAVTDSGIFVLLNLYDSRFFEVILTADPLSYVLVCKNDTIAIVKCRDKPILFKVDIVSMKVIQKVVYSVSGIGKLTLLGNYLFARAWEGKLLKISLENIQSFSDVFFHKKMISMNASSAGYIIIGTSNKLILKIDPFGKVLKEKQFSFRIDAYIYFSTNSEQIFLALPTSIKILDQELEIIKDIHTGIQSYSLQLTVDELYLIAGLQSGELAFFSLSSSRSVKIPIHRSSITSVFTTKDMSILYTFGTDSKLAVVYYPRLTLFKSAIEINLPFNTLLMTSHEFENNPKEHFKLLCMAVSDRKDLVIVGGESSNIAVWDRIIMRKCGDLIGHKGNVYSLACLTDSIAASGGADCKLIIWNYRLLRKESVLQGHTQTVSAVVKIDASRLASGSWDKSVIIWVWAIQEKLYVIPDLPERIVTLCTPKHNKILIGMPKFVSCWDLLTYCEMFSKESEGKIDCFRVLELSGSVYIGISMDEDSLWFEDPFNTKTVEVWGKDETKTYEFYYYIKGIINNENVRHKKNMDKFTVFPYKLNALHYYAYYNMPGHLAEGILNGGALVNSVCGANPLSISIELGHRECIEAIFWAAWEIRSVNPYVLSIVSVSTLVELHYIKCNFLSKAYKMLMVSSCSQISVNRQKHELPYLKCYQTCLSFNKIKNKRKEKMKISRTSIAVYLFPGCEKSLKYLKSLILCDLKVFETDFVKTLLLVKWKNIKMIFYLEVLLYFSHFLCLVSACFSLSFIGLTGLALVFGYVLFGFEVGVMGIRSYVGGLSAIQGFLLLVWSIKSTDILLSRLVIILSALYGVKYFQLFEKSSQVLQCLQETLIKIPMLFYALFYIFLLYYTFSNSQTSYPLSDLSFLEDLFYFSTYFLLIIFFSYHLSNTPQVCFNKNQYLAKTVLRLETIMFWNRAVSTKQFIQVIEEQKKTQVNRFKKFKRALKTLSKHAVESSKNHSASLQSTLFAIQQISNSLKYFKLDSSKSPRKVYLFNN